MGGDRGGALGPVRGVDRQPTRDGEPHAAEEDVSRRRPPAKASWTRCGPAPRPVRPEGILIQCCALGPCLVEGRLCLIREPPAMLDSIDGALSERTTPRPPERSVIDSFDDQEVGEPLDLSHLRLFAP